MASAWDSESASKPQVPVQIRKLYFLLLLAYEIQLRAGAPSHSIIKEAKKAKAAKPATAAKADGPLPAPKVAQLSQASVRCQQRLHSARRSMWHHSWSAFWHNVLCWALMRPPRSEVQVMG